MWATAGCRSICVGWFSICHRDSDHHLTVQPSTATAAVVVEHEGELTVKYVMSRLAFNTNICATYTHINNIIADVTEASTEHVSIAA